MGQRGVGLGAGHIGAERLNFLCRAVDDHRAGRGAPCVGTASMAVGDRLLITGSNSLDQGTVVGRARVVIARQPIIQNADADAQRQAPQRRRRVHTCRSRVGRTK
jgi:hypothetical protein